MQPEERILGVEGGGTKTAWVLAQRQGGELNVLEQGRLPPSNLRLTSPQRLREIFQEFPREIDRAGVFLAGCVTAEDKETLTALCREIWPKAKIVTGSDRESGMAAALCHGDGIVVSAGSGSSVTGRRDGRLEKAGGWGHILGDAGGAYFLVLQALRLILREYDLSRGELQFTAKILQALSLNSLDQLVRWAQEADKMEVALLAPVVFEAAAAGDQHVLEILDEGARALCAYTEAVANRLHLLAPKVVLIGGLFQRDSLYAHAFRRRLKKNLPDARVAAAERSPELGAAWLAAEVADLPSVRVQPAAEEVDDLAQSLTEQRNPRSEGLEKLTVAELVKLFIDEESGVQAALSKAASDLARAIEIVSGAMRKGGRLFYVGAGTSGRLGVLDASEIPPTFGAAPELVQGIVAGGVTALYRSAKGAEDERGAGAAAITERGIKGGDVVIGISASGRTPFVAGALARAKEIGARTLPPQLQSRLCAENLGRSAHQPFGWARDSDRVDAPESGNGDQDRAQYHQHRRNGGAGKSSRQPHDRFACFEFEVARSRDPDGGGAGRNRLCLSASAAGGERLEFAQGDRFGGRPGRLVILFSS